MNERAAFLKALKKNEDDTTTRLVFADWLDEQGEHEEADRMRKWPAAKAWLVKLTQTHNPPDPDSEDEWFITYEQLLELGREAVKHPNGEEGLGFSCGNNMDMADALNDNRAKFWKNWSIVTGIPLPKKAKDGYFSCAC